MFALTSTQMRDADRYAIEVVGIPATVLMDRAGEAVAEIAKSLARDRTAVIFTGPGNNGGDGFVAGKYLIDFGFNVTALALDGDGKTSSEAKIAREIFKNVGGNVTAFSPAKARRVAANAGVIIDALLGIGAKPPLRANFKTATEVVNAAGVPVVAVDVPTGVDATTGAADEAAVRAAATVTFGFPKIGLLTFPGRAFAGQLYVADIGYPKSFYGVNKVTKKIFGRGLVFLSETREVARCLPARPLNIHKGAAGRFYILAGSRGYSGAAVLAAISCLRAGGGLVEVGLPAELDAAFSAACLEAITQPLPQNDCGALTPAAAPLVIARMKQADAVAVGPGLGRDAETAELLRGLVREFDKPVVVDADGLNLLGAKGLRQIRAPGVITPHPGEASRLLGRSVAEVENDRLAAARALAKLTRKTVVLKGYLTVVAAPNGEAVLNPTGNAGLATAGTGDVLTGTILAFLKEAPTTFEAAVCGAYVHGLAGDIAMRGTGDAGRGLIAGDVVRAVPAALDALAKTPATEDLGLPNIFASYFTI